MHNDAVDLFWQVWGDGWKGSLDQLDATLTIPAGVPEGSERIWGHPASVGGTVQRDGRKITLAATGIPRNQFVELRTLLPRTRAGAPTMPGAQVVDDDAFSRIVSEEQADFDNSAAGFRKLQRVLDNRPLVALAVALAGLAAAIVLYGLAWLLYGREPEGEDSAVTYFPEPPDDAPPAVALALTNQGNAGPGDGDALAATLLDLIVRGRFKTRVGDGEHGPDLLLEQGDPSIALADHETPVVAIVESVLKDEPIPLSELGHRLGELSASQRTSNASRKSHFVSARGRLIKAERKQFRVPRADAIARLLAFVVFGLGVLAIIIGAAQYASHPAWNPLKWILIGGVVATFGFLVLTAPRSLWVSTRRESLPRIARWEAFRRYLEELPRLSDESPITLGTWEKLLVYATAFGCAERVAEAARLRVGEVGDGGLGRRHVGRAAVRPLVELRDGGRQRARTGLLDVALQQPRQSGVGRCDRALVVQLGRRWRLLRRRRRRGRRRRWRRRLVGGEGPRPARGEVDDRLRAVGCVAADVGAGGIELPLLQQRVEDAEVRRRIEPGAGHPLPVAGVGGQVSVDQVPPEPPLAAAPVDQQVLDEEAGADHPHPVRHEPLGRQLPHAGVDQPVARLATAPGLEVAVVVAPRDPLEPRVDRAFREVQGACAGRTGTSRATGAPPATWPPRRRPRARQAPRRHDTEVQQRREARRRRLILEIVAAPRVRAKPAGGERRDGGGRLPDARRPRDADAGRRRALVGRVGARPPDQLVRHADVVGVEHQALGRAPPRRGRRRRGERREVLSRVDRDARRRRGVRGARLLAAPVSTSRASTASRRDSGRGRRGLGRSARAARAAAAASRTKSGGPVGSVRPRGLQHGVVVEPQVAPEPGDDGFHASDFALSWGGPTTPIKVSMHWTAPALAALLLLALPLTATAHDCATDGAVMLPGAAMAELRGASPVIDAEPVTNCTGLTLAYGGGDDDLTLIGGSGTTAGLATLSVTLADGADTVHHGADTLPALTLAGGSGPRDEVDASARGTRVVLDESAGRRSAASSGSPAATVADVLVGDDGPNVLDGGSGDHVLVGRLGDGGPPRAASASTRCPLRGRVGRDGEPARAGRERRRRSGRYRESDRIGHNDGPTGDGAGNHLERRAATTARTAASATTCRTAAGRETAGSASPAAMHARHRLGPCDGQGTDLLQRIEDLTVFLRRHLTPIAAPTGAAWQALARLCRREALWHDQLEGRCGARHDSGA